MTSNLSNNMTQNKDKVWFVALSFGSRKYVPIFEHKHNAPPKTFKTKQHCQRECDKLNKGEIHVTHEHLIMPK